VFKQPERVTFDVGDRVRVRSLPATLATGIAERTGMVMGWTTPSLGYATDIIGDPVDDLAISLNLLDPDAQVWLTPDLIELIDHGEGTTAVIGTRRFVRSSDGTWEPDPGEDGPS